MTSHLRSRIVPAAACMIVALACSPSGGSSSRAPAGGDPACTPAPSGRAISPPEATPHAEPPAEPAGDGTRATICTGLGEIVIELFTESSPVAAENFINLAEAGFYDGVVFHRVIPDFVIQGGDPEGKGSGGPGYGIEDEPVVGEYQRGNLAMARPAGPGGSLMPDTQGSQFFIILADLRERLPKEGGYAIFGKVVEGMEVVDAIAARETSGPPNDAPLDPVVMTAVTVRRP